MEEKYEGWLTSPSIIKRSIAVYLYSVLGGFILLFILTIIMIPLILLFK